MELVLASAVPLRPPAAWFENPRLSEPTPIVVTEDGQVFGHAAAFGVCHTASPNGSGVCTLAPRSRSGYSYFHLGTIETEDGERLPVGQVTLGVGHAGRRLSAAQAAAHYDDTGAAVCDVRAGEDDFGIWIAGAVRPGLPDERVRELSCAKLSGDWRAINGHLELVGILGVNIPGFPVRHPQARVAITAAGAHEVLSLVAAGVVEEDCGCDEPPLTPTAAARRTRVLAARARGTAALADLAHRR